MHTAFCGTPIISLPPSITIGSGVVDDAAATGKTVTTVGSSETQPIIIGSALAVFVILAMAFFIGLTVNFTLVTPLRSLSALTRRIARGDTSARAHMTRPR